MDASSFHKTFQNHDDFGLQPHVRPCWTKDFIIDSILKTILISSYVSFPTVILAIIVFLVIIVALGYKEGQNKRHL